MSAFFISYKCLDIEASNITVVGYLSHPPLMRPWTRVITKYPTPSVM